MARIRKGMTIRAPWRYLGDDPNLMGTVEHVRNGRALVTWHDDGTVTPKGDASTIDVSRITDDDIVNPTQPRG